MNRFVFVVLLLSSNLLPVFAGEDNPPIMGDLGRYLAADPLVFSGFGSKQGHGTFNERLMRNLGGGAASAAAGPFGPLQRQGAASLDVISKSAVNTLEIRTNGEILNMTGGYAEARPIPGLMNDEALEVFEDLRNLAQGDRASQFADPVNPGKLNQSGEAKRDEFCSFVTRKATGLEGINSLRSLPRDRRAFRNSINRNGLGGGHSEVRLAYRFNTMAQDIMEKTCGRWTDNSHCQSEIFADPSKFSRTCEETFEAFMAPPNYDLTQNYEIAVRNSREHFGPTGDIELEPLESACSGNKNCYFLKGATEEESCNPFQCAMADEDSFPSGNFEFAKAFLMAAPGYAYSAEEPSLCDACFKKQFKTHTGKSDSDFDRKKEAEREKLEDALAGNAAGKDLLDFASGMETLLDMKAIYPYTFSDQDIGSVCAAKMDETISELKSERCGGRLDSGKLEYRIGKAFAAAGLDADASLSGAELVEKLYQKINPENSPTGCTREQYAKTAYVQWELNTNNDKQVKSFQDVVDHSFSSGYLDSVCSSGNYPRKTYAETYSENLALEHWNEIEADVREALANNADATDISRLLCPTNKEASEVVCGKFSMEDGIRPSNFMLSEVHEAGYIERAMSQGHTSLQAIREVIKSGTKAKAKASLEVAMKMKPTLRMVFGDWATLCNAKSKFKERKELIDQSIERARLHMRSASIYSNAVGAGMALSHEFERLDFSDFAEEYGESYKDLEEMQAGYQSSLCGKTAQHFKESICAEGGALPEDGNGSRFSAEDIEKAKETIALDKKVLNSSESLESALAFNSLTCELKSQRESNPSLFSSDNSTLSEIGGIVSSLEESLAVDERKAGIGRGDTQIGGLNFLTWRGCSDETIQNNERLLGGAGTGSQVVTFPNQYDPNKAGEARVASAADMAQEEREAPVITPRGNSGISDVEASVAGSGRFSSLRDEGSSIDLTTVAISPDLGAQAAQNSELLEGRRGNTAITQDDAQQVVADRAPASEESGRQEGRFQNLFGYMSEGSNAEEQSQNSASATPNYFGGGLPPQALEEPCNDECLEEIASEGPESRDLGRVAERAGLRNFESSNEDIKNAFESVIDERLGSEDLKKLQKENESLREQMAQIRQDLESKPAKVLDENGNEVSSRVRQPASTPGVVFNPRNHSENEFRSQQYFENRKDQFSPDFSSNSQPQRVSLGSYSEQRRAVASSTPVEQVKNYNSDIDRSFLQAHSSSPVDDTFVRDYVEHLDQNAGSLEHLVVFENGRPARIRVPDPKNPGSYVEHPLQGEVADLILERVEEDEVESYAVYNMVSFGQSLQGFMDSLEGEGSNLTTLSSLNNRLEEMRNLE